MKEYSTFGRNSGLKELEQDLIHILWPFLVWKRPAAVSMLQVNLLLPVSSKTPGSFSVLDLMRLPLGTPSGLLPVSFSQALTCWVSPGFPEGKFG
jgi:hypothetical protein